MANVQRIDGKKGISFKLTAFDGYGLDGKQIRKTKMWKPEYELLNPENVESPKDKSKMENLLEKAENEAKYQARKFQEETDKGISPVDGKTKLADFAAIWFDGLQVAHGTRENYRFMLQRILQALGHIQLQKLQPHHILSFYKNLAEPGIKGKSKYIATLELAAMLKHKNMTKAELASRAGVGYRTVYVALSGENIAIESAQKIAAALNRPKNELFTMQKNEQCLGDKAIRNHHRVLCSLLNAAKRRKYITNSPLEFIDPKELPQVDPTEAKYLDDEQARQLVSLLIEEPDIRIKRV